MIVAGIASIPSRVESLKRTIESLKDQVDHIFVGLNGYEYAPSFITENKWDYKLAYTINDNSHGDAMKFAAAGWADSYFITCDDDLIYPPNYAEYMVSKCKEHNCPVSLHGKCFEYPVSDYHRSFTRNLHCRRTVIGDHKVDVVGTGALCFDTRQVKVSMDDFKIPNMSDLWFAKLCKEQNIPLMVVEHQGDYLGYMEQDWTIWKDKPRNGDETRIINEILLYGKDRNSGH
jgi:hypothetical protein